MRVFDTKWAWGGGSGAASESRETLGDTMLRRTVIGVVCGVAGYAIGAIGGGLLISAASSNTHDPGSEAAMTGAFVTGPLVGLITAIVAFLKARPSRPSGP